MTSRTHMDRTDLSPAEIERIQGAAYNAEVYARRRLGARRHEDPRHPRIDIYIDDEPVQVKSIPPYARFVNAGNHAPVYRVLVVERRDGEFRLIGDIDDDRAWEHSSPMTGWSVCWWAPRSAIRLVGSEIALRERNR